MTNFSEYVRRDDVNLFAYVYISGIGQVFSNIAEPSQWSGLLGADRTWDRSLVFFRAPGSGNFQSSFSSIQQKSDFLTGTMVSGNLEIEFAVDAAGDAGTWRDLLVPTDKDIYYIDNSVVAPPSQNTVTLLATTGMNTGDILYSGRETFKVNAVGATYADTQRGKFDSEKPWRGNRGSVETTSSSVSRLTSWPEQWKGRFVNIWLETCEVDYDRNLVVKSTQPQGDYSKNIFAGIIYEMKWGEDYTSVRFNVQSIEQTLERSIMSRGREYNLGASFNEHVYIESGGPHLLEAQADDYWYREICGGAIIPTATDASVTIDLTDEWDGVFVHISEVLGYVCRRLTNHYQYTLGGDLGGYQFGYEWNLDGEGKYAIGAWYWRTIALVDSRNIGSIRLRYTSAASPSESILPAFGATDDVIIEGAARALGGSGIDGARVGKMQNVPPAYYVAPGNTRIYYRTGEAGYLDLLTGDPPKGQWTHDRDGEYDRHCFIKVGNTEIVKGRFYALGPDGFTALVDDDFGATYLTVTERGVLGTVAGPIIVTPQDRAEGKDTTKLIIGLGFDNHYVFDVLRWLAISTGDYATPASDWDALPEGFGAGIPPQVFDLESFDAAQDEIGAVATNWFFDRKTSLRSIFQMVGQAYGVTFTPRTTTWEGDTVSRFAVSAISAAPPSIADAPDFVIDSNWTSSINRPAEFDRQERNVVNNILFEFDYDHLERKYRGKDDRYIDSMSIERYGLSRAMHVKLPWVRSYSDADTAVGIMSLWVFAEYAEPPIIVTVPVMKPEAWDIELGDVVSLTHPYLPDYKNGGIGITEEIMQVVGKADEFGPDATVVSTLTLLFRNARGYYRPYVPCLKIKQLVAGETKIYEVQEDTNTGGFSNPARSKKDIDYFADAGDNTWGVSCYIPGEDAHQQRTVSAVNVDANTIELSAALTGNLAAAPETVVITFVPYQDALLVSPGQQLYTFMADQTSFLLTDVAAETREGVRWR